VWKNFVTGKLFTIVLFLVEKSPTNVNYLLTSMSARWRMGKERTTGLSKRGVSWGGGVRVRDSECRVELGKCEYVLVLEYDFCSTRTRENPYLYNSGVVDGVMWNNVKKHFSGSRNSTATRKSWASPQTSVTCIYTSFEFLRRSLKISIIQWYCLFSQ
jgi:hypothetical protein